MKSKDLGSYGLIFGLIASLGVAWLSVDGLLGSNGLFGVWFQEGTLWKMGLIWIGLAHITISCMSIAFHRSHTHQAVKLHPVVDAAMQTWLWAVTSMSKADWVSVHVYHHTHSDTPKDPHSPAQKGLLHVLFLGVFDYSRAKSDPEVLKIRSRIPMNAYEGFISRHLFLAPVGLAVGLMVFFGPVYGLVMSTLCFLISPVFAVGGVNAFAHAFGYQNYDAKDESRNLGFLFLLNWIICGELDHNNHHKYPKSPSFRHRWFEFDIGWVYIRMMNSMGLCRITGRVPVYRAGAVLRASLATK